MSLDLDGGRLVVDMLDGARKCHHPVPGNSGVVAINLTGPRVISSKSLGAYASLVS